MLGICAIVYNGGLSVSNDTIFGADKYLIEVDGIKHSKQVLTIKANSIFDINGKLIEGEKVECLFKADDGKKLAFVGIIKSRGKQLTVIHELLKSERYNEILNKVKQWQIQQTSQVI